MKGIRNFDDFITNNIVKKQSIDKSRAEFLIKESENGYRNLVKMTRKLGLEDDNANDFIKSCYDILMGLIRAKMLLEGSMLRVLGRMKRKYPI